MDEVAFLTLEMSDGVKFRWKIPKKYAWKLFLERWAPRRKEEPKEPIEEKEDENSPDEFKLW